MQLVSSRIWTRVAVSISYDDNHYTTGISFFYVSFFYADLWRHIKLNGYRRRQWNHRVKFNFSNRLFTFRWQIPIFRLNKSVWTLIVIDGIYSYL